jgi:hypothetical protein
MKFLWRRIIEFLHTRVGSVGIIFFTVCILIGALCWWLKISVLHPGLAFSLVALGLIGLVIAFTVDMQLRRARQSVPRLSRIEKLIEHWSKYSPLSQESGESISRQIALILEYFSRKGIPDISILQCFEGGKLEKTVVLVKPADLAPQVIKFGDQGGIEREISNYDRYVKERIRMHTPNINERYVLPGSNYGLIAYEFAKAGMATELKTFGSYYNSTKNDVKPIIECIDLVFGAMREWWDIPAQANPDKKSLYDEYERLGRNYLRIQNGYNEIKGQFGKNFNFNNKTKRFQLRDENWLSPALRNPIDWVDRYFYFGNQKSKQNYLSEFQLLDEPIRRHSSIVHGDFHARNILIEVKNNKAQIPWFIDFPQAHVGPTVQDMARLEADIKFYLIPDNELKEFSPQQLYAFENALLPLSGTSSHTVELKSVSNPLSNHVNFTKTWEVICHLRSKAQARIDGRARFYYMALLHATLPFLYYRDVTDRQKLYALISAALLCERLGGL